MFQELKLVVLENDRVIETISKQTHDTHPAVMVNALNEFRQQVNAIITKLIEDDPNDTSEMIEDIEGDSDNDEDDIEVSPKKRKK